MSAMADWASGNFNDTNTVTDTSSSSGGILSGFGSALQGISNIGLQWFGAATKGVSGPTVTPQPVQATPGAVVGSLASSALNYTGLIIVGVLVVIALAVMRKKR